jgi:hypothetical protein
MSTGKIFVEFDALKTHYPTYKKLPPELQKFMDDLGPPNTSCCVQMSHALNKAGQLIPHQGYRRPNSPIASFYYILAVDELEQYLSWRYGKGEEIKHGKKTMAQMKAYLDGKQGILLFRDGGAGYHTELWDGDHILQDGNMVSGGGARMNEDNIFSKPRVLFWEVEGNNPYMSTVPDWLQGWWEVWDGNYYYYYFSDQDIVTYTKTKPKSLTAPPIKMPINEGEVHIDDDDTVIINWNPADGGETVETFTRESDDKMRGVSNRYSPLSATKMK